MKMDISVVWAFSRLTFSSAREDLLPGSLADMDAKSKAPRKAVATTIVVSAGTSVLYFAGMVSQEILFELAGISFFMSYILAVIAFLKDSDSAYYKILGSLILIPVLLFFLNFGVKIIYPILMFTAGYFLYAFRKNGACRMRNS